MEFQLYFKLILRPSRGMPHAISELQKIRYIAYLYPVWKKCRVSVYAGYAMDNLILLNAFHSYLFGMRKKCYKKI